MMKTWIIYLNEVEKKITTQDPSNLSKQEILAIIQLLDVLKSFSRGCFEGLDNSNISIMSEIFKEIWPKIKKIINAFSTKCDIIEGIIQLTKYFMRGMKDDFKIYLEEYIKCLIDGYKLSPISSYIYGFEVLLTVFSKDNTVRTIIDNLFSEFCQITFDNYLTYFESKKICELNFANFQGINEIKKHARNYKGLKKPTFFIITDDLKTNIEVPEKFLNDIKENYPKMKYIEKKQSQTILIKTLT